MVVLDLEDAVAPGCKREARAAAVAAAREDWSFRELLIRVNGLDTPWGRDDLAAVADSEAAGVVLPKVNGPEEVQTANSLLASAPATTALWVMVETCAAMGDLPAIAKAGRDTRLSGLMMGFNDLAKEMRAIPDADRAVFQPFLAAAVAAARSQGLALLDGVCNALDDPGRLEAECRQGRAFGADGKALIHPSQIAICHAAFSPNVAALSWARRVVAAFEAPEAVTAGVVAVDGRMVERLHLEEAQHLLAADAAIRGR